MPAGAFSLAEETVKVEQETFTCEDYEYALLDDGTAKITKYHGEAEALEVPGELDGYAVTAIGDSAFTAVSVLLTSPSLAALPPSATGYFSAASVLLTSPSLAASLPSATVRLPYVMA